MKQNRFGTWVEDPIHAWFELTYAAYLTLPRSLLQEMPIEWQGKFVKLLDEMKDYWEWPHDTYYAVSLRDKKGRFKKDPLSEYRRPDIDYIDSLRVNPFVGSVITEPLEYK